VKTLQGTEMKRIGLWLAVFTLAPATLWGQAPPCGEEHALETTFDAVYRQQ
jgi:hypothetical protein